MGTRHLIAVKIDGEYKVAQYGQWDGYPSGQGVEIFEFLQNMDRNNFIEKCKKCHFGTQEEFDSINKKYPDGNWKKDYPHLSRDAGSDIFELISKSDGLLLLNSIEFSTNSLFCEYAYVVDFDTNKFEIFEGYNQEPLKGDERFYSDKPNKDGYYPVKLVKSYVLTNLPTEEEFLKDFEEKDEEE